MHVAGARLRLLLLPAPDPPLRRQPAQAPGRVEQPKQKQPTKTVVPLKKSAAQKEALAKGWTYQTVKGNINDMVDSVVVVNEIQRRASLMSKIKAHAVPVGHAYAEAHPRDASIDKDDYWLAVLLGVTDEPTKKHEPSATDRLGRADRIKQFAAGQNATLALGEENIELVRTHLANPLKFLARELAKAHVMLVVHPNAGLYKGLEALVREAVLTAPDSELVRARTLHPHTGSTLTQSLPCTLSLPREPNPGSSCIDSGDRRSACRRRCQCRRRSDSQRQ